jgi:hypothetical protein
MLDANAANRLGCRVVVRQVVPARQLGAASHCPAHAQSLPGTAVCVTCVLHCLACPVVLAGEPYGVLDMCIAFVFLKNPVGGVIVSDSAA